MENAKNTTIKAGNISNTSLVKSDASNKPFPDHHFDLLTCNLGINNFGSPAAVVKECGRIIINRREFLLTSNTVGHLQELYDVLANCLSPK